MDKICNFDIVINTCLAEINPTSLMPDFDKNGFLLSVINGSRAPNRPICSRDPLPTSSRAPNRQICSRDPPPSIPEPVDESILSPDKFVIKPDVIRIAVLLTEVGEGIFTAKSRVARFAVSLNE